MPITRAFLLPALVVSAAAFAQSAGENLVPDAPAKTPNYWCTWGAQNYAVDKNSAASAMSHSTLASNLTEKAVFGANGWARAFEKVRGDLYILYDAGWDVPRGVEFDTARWKLGSQEVAADKFPSCTGSPVERLRKLNGMTQRAGWRGAGLWIPAHAYGDGRDGKLLPEAELKRFFTERLRWTRDAGIEYWKIDYGARNNEPFRRMITRLAHEIAPGLKVEHSRGTCPLNDVRCLWEENLKVSNSGSFRAWDNGSVLKDSAAIARFSDVFRTYDVTPYLSIPTTFDRSAEVLAELAGQKEAAGIVNCEDEPYIAAALGLMMGPMRHPRWLGPKELGQEYDPRNLRQRIDEVTRAVRWHRIAPAFAMGASPVALDPKRLDDTWLFRKGDTWADWVVGTTVKQGAPARVSRGMALPEVKGADVPFVLAARNPNGAVSVATLPRIAAGRGLYFPLADIAIEVTDAAMPVGVFGRYRSLTLRLSRGAAGVRLMAQDLAGDSARDVTSEVARHGNEITIPGGVIERIGLSAATRGDVSDPGLVLKLSATRDRAQTEPAPRLVRQQETPVLTNKHPEAAHNKYGFEGGRAVKIGSTYHLFTSEMAGDPIWVKMRFGYWRSNDGLHWKRISTIFESSGEFQGKDSRASLWSPLPVFDDGEKRWNLFYVAYRSAPIKDNQFLLNHRGEIWRAVSQTPGMDGIGGPYRDVGIMMRPGPESDAWEGLQGTDSFFPYRVGKKWYALYGSARSETMPIKYWLVGMAAAPGIGGPWKRMSSMSPAPIEKVFIENPIVEPLSGGGYLCVYDSSTADAIGYAFSADGVHWNPGHALVIQPKQKRWARDVRTPLGLVAEGNGEYTVFYTGFEEEPEWNTLLAGNGGKASCAIGMVRVKLVPATRAGQ